MCGICGKLAFERGATVSEQLLKSMADTIYHRGPDDEGYYCSGPVGLGFRRLSIIDLSMGHQPLSNEDNSVWIVFNGEIYNYLELRELLLAKGHTFRTHSDTEVIVHLYEEFGEACVEKLRGMFGFAIWDDRKQTLLLARDRVGIKPLYYFMNDKFLVFGSEIKAILADPAVVPEIEPRIVDRFLTFYYVPGEETLIKNLKKLAPGSYMLVKDGKATIRSYWDLDFTPSNISLQQAEEKLVHLLEECVRMHMISDVPVGFLLSGGVDSTAMLGFAKGKTDKPLSSYTLGFSDPGIVDERPYAALAAKRYGSVHHEMTITSKDFADFLPQFAWHMEEPCCEPQAIALYYVSRMAKQFVTVLISGEGGDEAFAGYSVYRNMLWLERMKSVMGPLKAPLAAGIRQYAKNRPTTRLYKYPDLLGTPLESYYFGRTSNPANFFVNDHDRARLYTKEFARVADKEYALQAAKRFLGDGPGKGPVNKMLYVDTKTSLPDDLLLKADKMTMANSLELRVPFLDHKFLEFAASLPESFKVHGFVTKYLAKRTFKDRLPKEILERKKVGFPVPYNIWMRTELRDWIHDVLLDRSAIARGYFNRDCVETLLEENRVHGAHAKEILSLVSLELWHRNFLEHKGVAPPERSMNAIYTKSESPVA